VIVLDASAVIEVLMLTPTGFALGARLFEREAGLHAPELLDVEVAQIVRRYEHLGDLSASRGEEMIDDLSALPIERYGHRALLPRIWELRRNLTAYDAAYVALAEALDATLLTRDGRLARAPHRARVEVV
jgi:predicted nucleic acid-binding protein